MAVKLDIAAQTMDYLGAAPITSENEPTKRAKAFKRQFELARQAVLASHKWGFATEQVELAESSTHTPVYGYAKAFEVEAGTLKIWEADDKSWPHKRMGQFIYSNADTLAITRTKDIVEVGQFSPEFCEALAANIAWKIAYQITASREKEADMKDLYNEKLRIARMGSAVESDNYAETGSTWLDAAHRGVSDEPGLVR